MHCGTAVVTKVGCYADNYNPDAKGLNSIHPIPNMLFNDHGKTPKLYSGVPYPRKNLALSYIRDYICRCAERVLATGSSLFGLQHYGKGEILYDYNDIDDNCNKTIMTMTTMKVTMMVTVTVTVMVMMTMMVMVMVTVTVMVMMMTTMMMMIMIMVSVMLIVVVIIICKKIADKLK